MLGEHSAVVGSNPCFLLLSWVTLGKLSISCSCFLLIFRVGVKIKWRDAYEGINVNRSCALNCGSQWLGFKENGVFH